MFRLPFKVNGAAKTLKKCKKRKQKKIEIFCEHHPPTCQIKYEVLDFALIDKSIMANKLPRTILGRYLKRIKSPLTR